MSKEKLKQNVTPVGANCIRPHFEEMAKKENAITLIALVITIIVMLILVGVSVTVALNGGLFTAANKAKENTAAERDKELNLSDGKVEINGEEYNSIDEYVNGAGEPDSSSEITWTKTSEGELAVGSTVKTSTNEEFYVIGFAGDNNETVKLLAKDCIDTTNLVQSASANTIAFSESAYWTSIEGITYPYDLIETGEPDASHYTAKAAYDYGEKVGGTGRLMTNEEATALQTANSDILCGKNGKSSSESLTFWSGTAANTTPGMIYHIYGASTNPLGGCPPYYIDNLCRSAPSCRNLKS